MTQITIAQWLLNQQYPQSGGQLMPINVPRYQIVASKRFYGHYDVLDTHTGKREPCGNLATARATIKSKNLIK